MQVCRFGLPWGLKTGLRGVFVIAKPGAKQARAEVVPNR